ncbi:hypothetical protein ACO22_08137 [Paracoccidioides brasiliensis]|uniref:Uncharacterized protein n=1 Tax=Paracoccidioides brasiliensis TaxID=121759 RepID=A0A1D2J330_PARBR|nr:hypothetical protein ACO22_08137 [Paracoccidioides brasiliensis]
MVPGKEPQPKEPGSKENLDLYGGKGEEWDTALYGRGFEVWLSNSKAELRPIGACQFARNRGVGLNLGRPNWVKSLMVTWFIPVNGNQVGRSRRVVPIQPAYAPTPHAPCPMPHAPRPTHPTWTSNGQRRLRDWAATFI